MIRVRRCVVSEQLIVNVTDFETRVALIEGGMIVEVMIERNRDRGIVGNIYLGKVQRVLPGMQAAFVEIGTERAAFLYVGDVVSEPPEEDDEGAEDVHPEVSAIGDEDTVVTEVTAVGAPSGESISEEGSFGDDAPIEDAAVEHELDDTTRAAGVAAQSSIPGQRNAIVLESEAGRRRRKRKQQRVRKKIEELLSPGQTILVQVTKDAIGTKGPRVTCNISLPGRHLVFMPTHAHVGVSRRITDAEERQRLRELLESLAPEGGGFVVRTVSEGLSKEKLSADVEFLVSLWRDVQARSQVLSAPSLVQPELDIVLRSARDAFTTDVEKFVLDDASTFERLQRFTELLDPALAQRISLYEGKEPIFDYYGVETELSRAMSRKVWLKSGGYLVIDQAEALTAIDVNTGRFVGKRNLDDTILRTNLEAVKEVAYQLRLRNIGGMVIIDFIDMEIEEHRERVLQSLNEALKRDRARCNVIRLSELGLIEMTRQRTRESLGRQLTETCWYCEGRGVLKSKRTVVYDIFRALERQAKRFTEPVVVVHAHPEVVDVMYDEEGAALAAIEERSAKRIIVRPRGSFHQEQFDIFGTSQEAVASQARAAT